MILNIVIFNMINNISVYLFNPLIIYTRLWRIMYYPLIFLFKLPIDNQDNHRNSHLLSLLYSIIMSCLTPYTYYLMYNNYWLINQINSNVTEFIYNISLSYFISDLLIGLQFYPNILNSNILTSYIHHGAYILLFLYGKYTNKLHLFIYGMPYEIPTILLNIRYVTDKYKNYKLFGILFLFFRIFHNMYLLYKTFNVHNDLFIFCTCTFILHCYWFSSYVKRYVL
jgi:hypothetical protein